MGMEKERERHKPARKATSAEEYRMTRVMAGGCVLFAS